MKPEELLTYLLLYGLLGLIGQGIRVIIGLKKLNEDAKDTVAVQTAMMPPTTTDLKQAEKVAFDDKFDVRKLWLSLFIGFVAGCLVCISSGKDVTTPNGPEAILAVLAAGYAGTDFIEGIFKKLLPGN